MSRKTEKRRGFSSSVVFRDGRFVSGKSRRGFENLAYAGGEFSVLVGVLAKGFPGSILQN